MDTQQFLDHFMFDGGLIGLAVGHPSRLELYLEPPLDFPTNTDVYFTPALRAGDVGASKADVVGSFVVWVDVDDERLPRTTFLPSVVVNSGHGFHLYWFLNKPIRGIKSLEAINKVLVQDIPTADKASWNANRVLRVPGTLNSKKPVADVLIMQGTVAAFKYSVHDFSILARLDRKVRHKIKTGDRRGYKSRSERDWAVVTSLVNAGANDELIQYLFATQPVGDKVRDDQTHENYLPKTIQSARTSATEHVSTSEFSEGDDGYYIATRRGKRRISTFVISPKLLLDGSTFGAEDAIVGDVTATGYVWENKTFSRSAFTTVRKMDSEVPVAAWQWLGNDLDVRKLLPFLMEELVGNGLPRVIASPSLGFHTVEDKTYFIGDRQTLSHKTLWNGYGGPVAWLPNKREHPMLELTPRISSSSLETLRELIPLLNEPEAIWPLLGWYAASPLKPWLEEQGYRFPILNVTGSRGSGKTTLIQRVMMPIFGQTEPKSYDAGTTRFVTLALLGSTNAVPIAFSEFRYDSVDRFLRFVLLSYDTGHDPRGRPDQTTVDYPLTAPFSLDGEDIITDPAARQRIVVVLLTTRAIDEGSEAYVAYNKLRKVLPETFGGYYIQRVLEILEIGNMEKVLARSRDRMFEAFPSKLPDRVRNNHIVADFGMNLFCDAVSMDVPSPLVMERSIKTVYNTEAGRGRMLVDDLVEDIVNACNASTHRFKWDYDPTDKVLWFQLATAHSWWIESRRRQGRGALERDSLRQQLKEVHYARPAQARLGVWMYGIHLPTAKKADLDLPSEIVLREIVVRF